MAFTNTHVVLYTLILLGMDGALPPALYATHILGDSPHPPVREGLKIHYSEMKLLSYRENDYLIALNIVGLAFRIAVAIYTPSRLKEGHPGAFMFLIRTGIIPWWWLAFGMQEKVSTSP